MCFADIVLCRRNVIIIINVVNRTAADRPNSPRPGVPATGVQGNRSRFGVRIPVHTTRYEDVTSTYHIIITGHKYTILPAVPLQRRSALKPARTIVMRVRTNTRRTARRGKHDAIVR